MDYDFKAVLEDYQSKKTPDGRRDCIVRWAETTGTLKSDIAEDLLAAGCQVDGRILGKNRKPKTKPVNPAPPVDLPGWDTLQEVKPDTEPMTVATLKALLQDIEGQGAVEVCGKPLTGISIHADFAADGTRKSCVVQLIGG